MGAWRSLSSKRFAGRRGDAASAPDELKQNAVAMMDDELVEMLLETCDKRPQSCRPNRP
jgi:hypothetical protein